MCVCVCVCVCVSTHNWSKCPCSFPHLFVSLLVEEEELYEQAVVELKRGIVIHNRGIVIHNRGIVIHNRGIVTNNRGIVTLPSINVGDAPPAATDNFPASESPDAPTDTCKPVSKNREKSRCECVSVCVCVCVCVNFLPVLPCAGVKKGVSPCDSSSCCCCCGACGGLV